MSAAQSWLRKPWFGGCVGVLLLIGVWWGFTYSSVSTSSFPTPVAVVRSIIADGWGFYGRNTAGTLARAGWGYVWGNCIAFMLAALVLVVPKLEELVSQIGVLTNCLPITAIGPLVMVIFGSRVSAIALSAMLVFFTTLVGALTGLKSASRSQLDLIVVYGGNAWTQVRKVRILAACSRRGDWKIAYPVGKGDQSMNPGLRFVVRRVCNMLIAVVVVVLLWQVVLDAFDVNQMIGKRPAQVWTYLMGHPEAAEHRAMVFGN
ncbi:MAG: hypothetical protein L0K08_07395, partial [Bifidobacterium mongoliense]|nr:hypothetical protein [Bifidobacterium mongoliense]